MVILYQGAMKSYTLPKMKICFIVDAALIQFEVPCINCKSSKAMGWI